MTTLSWKRKLSTNVQSKSATLFKNNTTEDNEEVEEDWMNLLPRKKSMLEDSNVKSTRLMEEGIILAEQERLVFLLHEINLEYDK